VTLRERPLSRMGYDCKGSMTATLSRKPNGCNRSATVECPAVVTNPVGLDLSLLSDLQRVVDFDPEVSDSALKFAVTK
jgi:hypothetical protein